MSGILTSSNIISGCSPILLNPSAPFPAVLHANNAMVYDEAYCIKALSNAYFGTMSLIKEGNLPLQKDCQK